MFKGEPIIPNNTLDWNGKLMRIPPIAPSIISCRILKVEYFVRVTLLIPGSLLNLHIQFPIVIGTIPYKIPSIQYENQNIASTSQETQPNDCKIKSYTYLLL